jgi:hypothetical protein
VLPLAGIAVGAVVVGALAVAWSRRGRPSGDEAELDADLERRVDDELARFER